MRTTLTLDDDVAALLQKELRRSGDPLKQTINRLLRTGLAHAEAAPRPKAFVVEPLNLGTTPKQWTRWADMKLNDILEEAEMPSSK